jgi:hypothetical protein
MYKTSVVKDVMIRITSCIDGSSRFVGRRKCMAIRAELMSLQPRMFVGDLNVVAHCQATAQ